MTYDRDDARSLAEAALRQRRYAQRAPSLTKTPLLEELLEKSSSLKDFSDNELWTENQDLKYLATRCNFSADTINYVLADWDEPTVVEALRRCHGTQADSQAYLRGVCRNISEEADAAEA